MIKAAEPCLGQEEIDAATEVLRFGNYVSGQKVAEFEEAFAEYIGVKYAVAVNSGTSALHLALLSCGVGKGDEVIVPALTFYATVEAVLYTGATPVFVDVDPYNYCLYHDVVLEAYTSKTKAMIPVHLFGYPYYDSKWRGVYTIEDCSQAHGAAFNGWRCGSFGEVGCFSFYATKNMTVATEGGILTTDEKEIVDKCRLLRNHGMVNRHIHKVLGYNYRMNEIAAAIGLVQLKKLDVMNKKRQEIADYYDEHLNYDWLRKPRVPAMIDHAWFTYPCMVDTVKLGFETPTLVNKLRGLDVEVRYRQNYCPSQPVYNVAAFCPVAYNASIDLIGLPMHPNLSKEDLQQVVAALDTVQTRKVLPTVQG